MGRVALSALTAVLLLPRPGAAVTLEDIVQRHLAWLARTNNCLVELRQKGVAQPLGTVFIDNTKSPREVSYQGDVPIGARTRKLVITGTRNASRASVDGARNTQWTLPQGPFNSSFDLFQRGVGVKETIDRINTMASQVTVLENPVGGRYGIKMQMAPGFLGEMDGFLDSLLLGGSIPRDIDSTLWFTTDGRLDRMVLQEGKPDMVITTLKYLEVNVGAQRRAVLVPKIDTTRGRAYPSLVDMMKSVATEDGSGAN